MSGLKLLIKLVIAALIANASWQLGSAYARFYRFKDAVNEAVLFGGGRSDGELQQRILEIAGEYDFPATADDFTITHQNERTIVTGETTQVVTLAPGFTRPWTFDWNIEVLAVRATRPHDAVR